MTPWTFRFWTPGHGSVADGRPQFGNLMAARLFRVSV